MRQQCAQWYSGVQVEGGIPSLLVCHDEATSGVMCPVPSSSVQEKHELLETVRLWATKIIRGLKYFPYKEELRDLGLFSMEKTKTRF